MAGDSSFGKGCHNATAGLPSQELKVLKEFVAPEGDLEHGLGGFRVASRFTFDAAPDASPIWSPDGSRIVFSSNRKGVWDLYQKPATGAGSEEVLLATPQLKVQSDWSPDGRFLLYRSLDPKTGYDLWALPFDGGRKPFPVVQTNSDKRDGQFSPDGKWIAYQSDESGRFEIYVQPFPGPGGTFQVSTSGGAQVRWRHDGRELFYIALDGRLMAVPIALASNGQVVEAGAPLPLFTTHVGGAVQSTNRQQYIVSPDGQRFLMNTLPEEASTSPITVMLNWKPKRDSAMEPCPMPVVSGTRRHHRRGSLQSTFVANGRGDPP